MSTNAGTISGKLTLDANQFKAELQAGAAAARQSGEQIARDLGTAGQKVRDQYGRFVKQGMDDAAGSTRGMAREIASLVSEAQRGQGVMAGFVGGITASLSNAAISSLRSAAGEVASFVASSVKLAAQNEQTAISFEVLTGSAEAGRALMAEIREFAEATPYGSAEIANAAKQLLAFGVGARDAVPTMRRLGDVSAALNIPLGEMAYLYGTTRVQGRLFTQDLNQFTSRGIPLIGELAKQFGVAESEVKSLVESGAVGFPEVEKAIAAMTSEGGRFFGMMDRQSQSAMGLWSTLQDTIDSVKRSLGEGLIQDDGGKQIIKDLIAEAEKLKPLFADAGKALAVALKEAMPAMRELLSTATAILKLASGQVEKEQLANATPQALGGYIRESSPHLTEADNVANAEAVIKAAQAAQAGIQGVISAGAGQGMDKGAYDKLNASRGNLNAMGELQIELDNLNRLKANGEAFDPERMRQLNEKVASLSEAVASAQGLLNNTVANPAWVTNSFSDFSQESWDKMRDAAKEGAAGTSRGLDGIRERVAAGRVKAQDQRTKSAAMNEDHDAEHMAGNAPPPTAKKIKADEKAENVEPKAESDLAGAGLTGIRADERDRRSAGLSRRRPLEGPSVLDRFGNEDGRSPLSPDEESQRDRMRTLDDRDAADRQGRRVATGADGTAKVPGRAERRPNRRRGRRREGRRVMPSLDLVSYQQAVDVTEATTTYQVHQYAGADPLMTRQKKTLKIVSQSGRGVAWQKRLVPPAPLFPNNLIEQPKVEHSRIDICHWQTTWHYLMAVAAGEAVPIESACSPPTNPTFEVAT
jgi:Tape measure protein